MDYSLSQADHSLCEAARQLALERFGTVDRPPPGFDQAGWRQLADFGVFRVDLRDKSVGLARAARLLEALGAGGADRGLLFAAGAHLFGCLWPLVHLGSPAQQAQWVPGLASGDQIGALAITEPEAGSAISALRTSAVSAGGEVVLQGHKTLVTNATVAQVLLLIAVEFPQRGSLGLSAFLVPTSTPGITIRPLATVGLDGAPAGEIELQTVRLSATARLGPAGGGLGVLLAAMQAERTAILAGFLGAAEYDLARCHHFLKNRRQGGDQASLADHQAVQHKLAEIRCRLETARAMLYRGVWEVSHGRDRIGWPAMVKKTVSEAVAQSAYDLQCLYAGAGWQNRNRSATAVQDTLAILSASGTTQVQLNTIASQLAKTLVPLASPNSP